MSDSKNLEQQNQEVEEQEQPDAIALLAERLASIEAALGVGNSKPNDSNLLGRLSAIETSLSKDQRERNLPATITRSQATNPSFMKRAGILLEDISGGKIQIVEG